MSGPCLMYTLHPGTWPAGKRLSPMGTGVPMITVCVVPVHAKTGTYLLPPQVVPCVPISPSVGTRCMLARPQASSDLSRLLDHRPSTTHNQLPPTTGYGLPQGTLYLINNPHGIGRPHAHDAGCFSPHRSFFCLAAAVHRFSTSFGSLFYWP